MKPLPPAFRDTVRDRLRARAAASGLDGLLILAPGNLAYATGWMFSVNERPMGLWLPVAGDPVLMVPHLELENALSVAGVTVATYPEFPGDVPPVLWMLGQTRARRIGVDALEARLLTAAQQIAQIDLTDHVLPERAVKHPAELDLIREAARYADMVLTRLLAAGGDIIGAGGTELDLMADATGHARAALAARHGAAFQGTKMGITASVHSGPRAALPHGTVLARRPQKGEPIIAGIGCSLGGYHAESGVTLVYGDITSEQARVMAAMDAANAATVDALTRRLPCSAVNEAALAPIRAAGFGDAIRHRIGHGMGVEGHEAPWLSPGDATPAAPGMVFSCEPGIYRPELDGWRCIETLIVTDTGCETASRFQSDHPAHTRIIPA
ncbi:M24 family metallopeptidase [Pseudotabrizicola algicola]|uniref:Aminopeptidase P family protein n=1 Tax=Pseudotabrizicola algicola TaxID=2709381 RepID=A0A6B3RRK2_9RHOB|nr:Xaa-Pro peptidase family protein [Pseudotabrizicola algicola]NEX46615.1 aminopeptidase P family protein [Pseudotabrizicola algicola]